MIASKKEKRKKSDGIIYPENWYQINCTMNDIFHFKQRGHCKEENKIKRIL